MIKQNAPEVISWKATRILTDDIFNALSYAYIW